MKIINDLHRIADNLDVLVTRAKGLNVKTEDHTQEILGKCMSIIANLDERIKYLEGKEPTPPTTKENTDSEDSPKGRKKYNRKKAWTKYEDQILMQGRGKGLAYFQIAKSLPGRTECAVGSRASVLRAAGYHVD